MRFVVSLTIMLSAFATTSSADKGIDVAARLFANHCVVKLPQMKGILDHINRTKNEEFGGYGSHKPGNFTITGGSGRSKPAIGYFTPNTNSDNVYKCAAYVKRVNKQEAVNAFIAAFRSNARSAKLGKPHPDPKSLGKSPVFSAPIIGAKKGMKFEVFIDRKTVRAEIVWK